MLPPSPIVMETGPHVLICAVPGMRTGAARHGTARHGTARHSTAQHSTAQHSTAQHGTARARGLRGHTRHGACVDAVTGGSASVCVSAQTRQQLCALTVLLAMGLLRSYA
jgi:hypothetical protein